LPEAVPLFVVPLVVPLLLVPLVPLDIVLLVPLSLVPVVPVVLQPKSARVRVSTAMRVRTALCVRFIVDPPEISPLLAERFASLANAVVQNSDPFCVPCKARQWVPVEPVAAEVDVVPVVDVPLVDVVLVDVPPLPSEVVAVFVTGAPAPVSVAVVPLGAGWSVSVEPVVVSAGCRLQAVQRRRTVMTLMTPRMRIDDPPHACGAIVAPGWRAT
jgi:hypothetical protein